MLLAGVVFAVTGVSNGGFETGDFTGWSTGDISVVPTDTWYVYTGNRSPVSDTGIARPKEGDFGATTDSNNPGSHVLYQDIEL